MKFNLSKYHKNFHYFVRKAVLMTLFMAAVHVFGQIAIGKPNVDGTTTLLDFAANTNKAIVLPRITSNAGITEHGALFFDAISNKVVYRNNSNLVELTPTAGSYNASYLALLSDINNGVIMGSSTSSALGQGVLILESNNKAMILPKNASPHLNIKSPLAGTMSYDTDTGLIAIYNGTEWFFWGQ